MPPVCRNCGREAGPTYCGHCGQALDEHRQPIARLAGEWLTESFALDGRMLRSLGGLLRPGRLTERYLAGERARFVPPFRLYFVASLLLFASVLAVRPFDLSGVDIFVGGELVAAGSDRSDGTGATFEMLEPGLLTSVLQARYPERFERLRAESPQAIGESFIRSLLETLPVALLVALPLFALGLKLFYVRTGILYVDHVIFAVHFQSAVYLAAVAGWVMVVAFGLEGVFRSLGAIVALLGMLFVYLPLALRRVYGQAWWLTALKTIVVLYAFGMAVGSAVELAQVYWFLTF